MLAMSPPRSFSLLALRVGPEPPTASPDQGRGGAIGARDATPLRPQVQELTALRGRVLTPRRQRGRPQAAVPHDAAAHAGARGEATPRWRGLWQRASRRTRQRRAVSSLLIEQRPSPGRCSPPECRPTGQVVGVDHRPPPRAWCRAAHPVQSAGARPLNTAASGRRAKADHVVGHRLPGRWAPVGQEVLAGCSFPRPRCRP